MSAYNTQYYKWMFEDDSVINRIPGFVFVDMADVIKFSEQFEEWVYDGGKSKNLYVFNGVKPTLIKQFLTSHFGFRTPPHSVHKLDNNELQLAYRYFNDKPVDWFTYKDGDADIPIMLNIAKTVGCIKYHANVASDSGVASVEAFYFWPATMTKVEQPEIISQLMSV